MTDNSQRIRVLAVEDDDVDHLTLQRALKRCEINVSLDRATTLKQAKKDLDKVNYHCVLLDFNLPDGSGLDLLNSSDWNHDPDHPAVIMLTGEDDVGVAVAAMKSGAQDYLAKKDICSEALDIAISKALENSQLQRQVRDAQKKIEELAFFDPLTGLPNRRVFEDRLEQLIRAADRNGSTFMLGMLDLNGFKAINDNLGHQAGDTVLKTIASRMASIVRDGDTVARYGGDEFVLLIPQARPRRSAKEISMRILSTIADPIAAGGEELHINLSIGLSFFPDHGEDAETLILRADEAMYHAKVGKTGWGVAEASPLDDMDD